MGGWEGRWVVGRAGGIRLERCPEHLFAGNNSFEFSHFASGVAKGSQKAHLLLTIRLLITYLSTWRSPTGLSLCVRIRRPIRLQQMRSKA